MSSVPVATVTEDPVPIATDETAQNQAQSATAPGTTTTASTASTTSITSTTIETSSDTLSDGSTSTDLPIFDQVFPLGSMLESLGGSIAAVDWDIQATTIVLDCLSEESTDCAMMDVPFTITSGPSTYAYTAYYTQVDASYSHTDVVSCAVTESAVCDMTYYSWFGSTTTAFTRLETSTYSPDDFTYEVVPITAGLEKLSSTSDATATPSESTSGADSNSDSDSGGSSSKAWIAGPVVGAIVGCALIAGAIWFWLRRRRAGAQSATGTEAQVSELDGKDAFKTLGKAELQLASRRRLSYQGEVEKPMRCLRELSSLSIHNAIFFHCIANASSTGSSYQDYGWDT
ncbi:hypothetical protein BJX99DRAFT_236180 [Aspergillus californicus]